MENDPPCIHTSDVTMPINNEVFFTCPNQNNDSVPTAPTIMVDPLQNPNANDPMNIRDVEQLRLYIEKECYQWSQWSHLIIFKGSVDRKHFSEMDVTKYVGDCKFKDKEGKKSYRIYFYPNKYSVTKELEVLSSLPENATIQEKVQSKFKSSSYMLLSNNLRKACGSSGFNIVLNGNQNFNWKKKNGTSNKKSIFMPKIYSLQGQYKRHYRKSRLQKIHIAQWQGDTGNCTYFPYLYF